MPVPCIRWGGVRRGPGPVRAPQRTRADPPRALHRALHRAPQWYFAMNAVSAAVSGAESALVGFTPLVTSQNRSKYVGAL